MSRDYVNIERTNKLNINMTDESFHKEFFFDIDSNIPFHKLKAPITLIVGCLYDFTYNLNEYDCICDGDTFTYLVVKAESEDTYYLVEYINNMIFRTLNSDGYRSYTRCHAKDVLGFDLNTFKYEFEREPKIVELPSVNIGDTIYVKDSYGYAECTVSGLVYTEKGWRVNVNHYALWDSPFVCEEGKTWVRTRVEAIEKFASDVNLPFSEEEKEKLEEMINAAICDECSYNKDNITNDAWDFFENSAPAIILNYIAHDIKVGDVDGADDVDYELINHYLKCAICEYEKTHGNIRDYSGD